MKKILITFVLLLILILVIIFIPVFISDEELNEGANDWITHKDKPVPVEENAFNIIAGFVVSEYEDAFIMGASLIEKINNDIKASNDPFTVNDGDYWQGDELLTPTDNIKGICNFRDRECFRWVVDNQKIIRKYIDENKELLTRYNDLSDYDQYEVTILPEGLYIEAPYSSLRKINKLNNIKIVSEYITGDHDIAIRWIENDIAFFRVMITNEKTHIGKSTGLKILKNNLYTYSAMMNVDISNLDAFSIVDSLTLDEISGLKVMRHSFLQDVEVYDTYVSAVISGDIPYTNVYEQFFMKYWYKPNHVLNWSYEMRSEDVMFSIKTAKELYYNYDKKVGRELIWEDWIINPPVVTSLDLSPQSISKTIVRAHDIDGLIVLVNLKRILLKSNVTTDNIEDYLFRYKETFTSPYDGSQIQWDKSNHELFFDSPDNKSESNRLHISF